jgi:hypothetical protein
VPPWSGAALVTYKRSEAAEGYGPAGGSRKLRMRRVGHPRGRGVAGGRRLGGRPASPAQPLAYTAAQLDRAVVAEDQIRTVIRIFKDKLITELFPAGRGG